MYVVKDGKTCPAMMIAMAIKVPITINKIPEGNFKN
jgi:hypothetical protein